MKRAAWRPVCLSAAVLAVLVLIAGCGGSGGSGSGGSGPSPVEQRVVYPQPFVAIHVSETTQALESAGRWSYGFGYSVAYGSLKEALRSDGTPFVEVSDADIASGRLLQANGVPRYPILVSLASEALSDSEIAPLLAYVRAGGFLLVGSSSFVRNPDGTVRADMALADQMGLHNVSDASTNWSESAHLTKTASHRLVSHIPDGTLNWRRPLTAEEITGGVTPDHALKGAHYVWAVRNSGATVLVNADSGPLLAVKEYGQGQFVYHAAFQPLLGHGGSDPGMYGYLICRKAIEWAFESFDLPIIKVSPWRYPYDSALVVRYDFGTSVSDLATIDASAQFENGRGVRGDYYFSTGALRTDANVDTVVTAIKRAVTSFGATIGSSNGGLRNPANPTPAADRQDYWYWGPDEVLDQTSPVDQNGRAWENGAAYATASVSTSFEDIESWLSGLDNGRAGCAAAGNCPRRWLSPYSNATRDGSKNILKGVGVTTAAEQKIGPFPHWVLSYKNPGQGFPGLLSLPVSDWYVNGSIVPAIEDHTTDSIKAAVDFYHGLGGLIGFVSRKGANNSATVQEYIAHSVSKPRVWTTNSTGVHDWWESRSNVRVVGDYQVVGPDYVATISVTGVTDQDTAVEILVPNNSSRPKMQRTEVLINGKTADLSDYRTTDYGLKIRVGPSVSDVKVICTP